VVASKVLDMFQDCAGSSHLIEMPDSLVLECKAVLFDLDGVLVDSDECVKRVCKVWAMEHGLDPDHVFRMGQGRRTLETVRAVAPHLDAAIESAKLSDLEARTTEGVRAVPGARELVECIPNGAWAVVTSGAKAAAQLRLAHVGIRIPEVIVCAEDVRVGKPDPEGYLAAARRLGRSPEECVVIEDSPAGLRAAAAARMRSIGVQGAIPLDASHKAMLLVRRVADLSVRRTAQSTLMITVS
jgi:sugar-phosphatase